MMVGSPVVLLWIVEKGLKFLLIEVADKARRFIPLQNLYLQIRPGIPT